MNGNVKRKIENGKLLIVLFAFSIFHFQSSVNAQSGGTYEIKKSVVANGGAAAEGGTLTVTGTTGQSAAGTYSGNGRYTIRSGFWTNSVPKAVNGKIVYTNGGNIWKMDPDGSNRQLVIDAGTNDIEPASSPDGSKIAFKSDRSPTANGGIWVVNADGTGLTVLTPEPGLSNAKPTWSPDGSKIAFHSNRDGLIGSIYVMNADGSNVTRLTNQFPFSDAGAEWSPDGTRMIFETNQNLGSNIGIINLDGTGRAVIGAGQFPAWSPDGTKIIYALLTATGYHINTSNTDGTGITQLTFGVPNDYYPSFSPDGSKIVFARNTSGIMGLWTMNADGSGQVIFSGTNTIGNGYSDWQRASNTPAGMPATLRIDEATITFSNVSTGGTTTFTPIIPDPASLPSGFALCPTCPSYDISTTAVYTPPVTVCLQAPSVTSPATFGGLALLHGVGGTFVDVTLSRNFATKTLCGQVTSLSPFVAAHNISPTAAGVSVSGRVVDVNGRVISRARIALTGSDGTTRTTLSNAFGRFSFENVGVGQTYVVSVSSRRYQFSGPAQVITPMDALTDLIFIGQPL